MRLTRVLLDANVLVDAQIRDLFLRLGDAGLIEIFWSATTLDELRRVLVEKRKLDGAKVEKLVDALGQAFPSATISTAESTETPDLPDPGDRHVLAAAIQQECDLLVTFNTRDFPDDVTFPFDLWVIHPDEALTLLFGWFSTRVVDIVDAQIEALRQPTMSREGFLERLASIAPHATMVIGAAFGIEIYARMLRDVLDADQEQGPQGPFDDY